MKKTFSQKVEELKKEATKQWQKNYSEYKKTENRDFLGIAYYYRELEKQLDKMLEDIQTYKDNSTLFENL